MKQKKIVWLGGHSWRAVVPGKYFKIENMIKRLKGVKRESRYTV